MKKINKPIIFTIFIILSSFIFIGLFFIDIGINSKYFIKKNFNQAFQYRSTGDCNSFADYLNRDTEDWRSTCEKEKTDKSSRPIRRFTIQNISHKIGSNRAFLQVELTRNIEGKDYSYSVNYEMRKIGLIWKIDQEKQ